MHHPVRVPDSVTQQVTSLPDPSLLRTVHILTLLCRNLLHLWLLCLRCHTPHWSLQKCLPVLCWCHIHLLLWPDCHPHRYRFLRSILCAWILFCPRRMLLLRPDLGQLFLSTGRCSWHWCWTYCLPASAVQTRMLLQLQVLHLLTACPAIMEAARENAITFLHFILLAPFFLHLLKLQSAALCWYMLTKISVRSYRTLNRILPYYSYFVHSIFIGFAAFYRSFH